MDPSARTPRGRPPGSRNRTSSISSPMAEPDKSFTKVFAFNVPPNRDIMEFIFDIAHKDQVNVSVLNASGMINIVTLHNSQKVMLHGPFTLLSLTGSYLCKNHYTLHPGVTSPFPLCFGINLSASHGQIIGGVIGGSVIAGEDVCLTISTFKNPGFLNYTFEQHDNSNDNHGNKSGDFIGGCNLLGFNSFGCGVRGWRMN
ncbi:unnamed protein product [Sphenostylis stenocarpa]|uniref:PPC domain-containing protein n=1 Tax=Sphenostylis stenocarpa TaxID=92480 RepID=A0AA86SLT7_9FABA|nr:unnamed protein product [Sphenostylis stenocarpa]